MDLDLSMRGAEAVGRCGNQGNLKIRGDHVANHRSFSL
jgi:hypothetical protein